MRRTISPEGTAESQSQRYSSWYLIPCFFHVLLVLDMQHDKSIRDDPCSRFARPSLRDLCRCRVCPALKRRAILGGPFGAMTRRCASTMRDRFTAGAEGCRDAYKN